MPGDTIGVVAPAAAVEEAHLQRGAAVLRALGYQVQIGIHALARDRVLAGGDAERAADLTRMFRDPAIKAIFAARGGYGSGRLLPLLDFTELAANPKIFVGFSDHTFLLNALLQLAGLVCFHGPVVAKDLSQGISDASLTHLRTLLAGESDGFSLDGRDTIHPGVAEGELVGGCLSIVVAMLGTPFAPEFADKVLFLEDTGERAYRIDRMLVQLRQAGALAKVAGIVLGGLRVPRRHAAEQDLVREFIAEQTAKLGIPVLGGIEAGHATENFALPLGTRVRVDSDKRRLTFLERAVE